MLVFKDMREWFDREFGKAEDSVSIATGYTSSTLVSTYAYLAETRGIRFRLLLGMAVRDGLVRGERERLIQIPQAYPGTEVRVYPRRENPLHAKVYLFDAERAFVGSANFSYSGLEVLSELVTQAEAGEVEAWFDDLWSRCTPVGSPHVDIPEHDLDQRDGDAANRPGPEEELIPEDFAADAGQHVILELMSERGYERSGLNWGQRPELNRDPNQAYLRVQAAIQRQHFFPEVGDHFRVKWDDGRKMTCVRAQAQGKAIHTPENNALLGLYLRERLGVASGALVTPGDLARAGFRRVRVTKVSGHVFKMSLIP